MAYSVLPKLVIEEGPNPGQEVILTKAEFVIGRETDVDFVIASPAVSRRHLRISRQENQYVVEDLGSSNGTFVNGQRISKPTLLQNGDRLALGQAIRLSIAGLPVSSSATMSGSATVADQSSQARPAPLRETMVETPPPGLAATVVREESHPVHERNAPQLLVTVAGDSPRTYILQDERVTLGRASDNSIVLASRIVSGHHAVLERSGDGYRIRALPEAANPILLSGESLREAKRLSDGDTLRIGSQDPGMMVTLVYLSPAEAGQKSKAEPINFAGKDRLQIGRDPSNDVVLASPTVSRYHAVVERIGQRYRVRDLNSSNGTFVNEQRISGEVWLQAGDVIHIGPHRFVLGEDQLAQVQDGGGMQVEILGLNKWVRKDLNLLKNISLLFQPKEFIVVVGQSGGGKSTLLDAVAGFRPATHGQVLVNNIDIYRHFDAIRNEIGFVPQKDIIHMELTVYQALDYAAKLRMPADTTREERHQRIMEVLQDLDLAHRKDVQISGLSGGQQKRVSIGVELLTKPGLFFLDEPTSGLDPGTETALMHLMRRLADQGRTIILITHATKNVMLADKVVFLARGGYVAWFGPPDQALQYFDQFREERDRRAKPMEFDEIYAILDDPSKGKAEEWARRYLQHPAYQEHVVRPLQALGRNISDVIQSPAAKESANRLAYKPLRNRVSGLRQFAILSARNIKILFRDRASLVLMLVSAPLTAMLDVLLAVILGRDLFSFSEGDAANAIVSLFQPIIFAIMIGGLSQMREFVKEAEIFKRERLVNLKVLPYVMSKIWVAALLALYQAATYTIIHYLAFKMPGGTLEFLLFYLTLTLATLAGMMLGLLASAVAPNANAAPLIVILLIIPQVVLGGALIPMPSSISAVTVSRWAFEPIVGITGLGSDVAADACWQLDKDIREEMDLADKEALGCRCIGLNALRETSCNFPGLGEFYDPAIDQAEPVEPASIGDPPAEPQLPPAPQSPTDLTDQAAMAQYLQKLQEYQRLTKQIQDNYRAEVNAYQEKADQYAEAMKAYQEEKAKWEISRNAAVGKAEGMIDTFHKNFGWAFVNRDDADEYWSRIWFAWAIQGVIIGLLFVLMLFFIYRKGRA
jgi:ABC-type multidrug transport system ATPase subunit/predicted component of type VI protein secretion system